MLSHDSLDHTHCTVNPHHCPDPRFALSQAYTMDQANGQNSVVYAILEKSMSCADFCHDRKSQCVDVRQEVRGLSLPGLGGFGLEGSFHCSSRKVEQ